MRIYNHASHGSSKIMQTVRPLHKSSLKSINSSMQVTDLANHARMKYLEHMSLKSSNVLMQATYQAKHATMKHLGKSSVKSSKACKCAISQLCKSCKCANMDNISQHNPKFTQTKQIKQIMRPCNHAIKNHAI